MYGDVRWLKRAFYASFEKDACDVTVTGSRSGVDDIVRDGSAKNIR
jgi:hypothetical protein